MYGIPCRIVLYTNMHACTILYRYSIVSREGLAPIVKAYSRLILVDGLVL
jgi:hypothetical protein